MSSARSLACQRNDPFLQGCGHGRGPVIHAQLAVNMNEVGFDRCRADVQTFADFFVACSFGHQLQHFNLAGAQVLFGWGTHPGHEGERRRPGPERSLPGGGAYGVEQFFTGGIFQQVAGGPGFDSARISASEL